MNETKLRYLLMFLLNVDISTRFYIFIWKRFEELIILVAIDFWKLIFIGYVLKQLKSFDYKYEILGKVQFLKWK